MKCEVKRYGNQLWVKYWVEKSDEWFILDIPDEKIEEIKTATLDKVHQILNDELYKKTKISFWPR